MDKISDFLNESLRISQDHQTKLLYSILILVVISVAFTMMYGFMVESKATRNRFLFYGLGAIFLSLGLYFIPLPFRWVIN